MAQGLVPSAGITEADIQRMIADALNRYPEIRTQPTMPTRDPNRISAVDIEKQIGSLHGEPLDYSKVEEAQRQRARQAERGMAAGMLMHSSGGEAFGPLGAKIFEQALGQAVPMRPNAADIGYINPTTGQFVENPQFERGRREKVLTQALAAADRQERSLADIAAKQSAEDRARVTAGVNAGQRMPNIIINQQRADQAYDVGLAREERLATPKPDELTNSQRKEISDLGAEVRAIDNAMAAVRKAPTAFTFKRGVPKAVAGSMGESIAGRFDTPDEIFARSQVFNIVSALIKERAGTAATQPEQARINAFMPAETDDDRQVLEKFDGYKKYIEEKRKEVSQIIPKVPSADRPIPPPGGGSPKPPSLGGGRPSLKSLIPSAGQPR